MIMHSKRNEAIEMRKNGATYSEITAATGIQKSTLSYMLSPIKLTEEHKIRIKDKQIDGARHALSKITKEQRVNGGKQAWKNLSPSLRKKRLKILANGALYASLCYRKDELPVNDNCAWCGLPIIREKRRIRSKNKKMFCSTSHGTRFQHSITNRV